jgi:hypothetical protein
VFDTGALIGLERRRAQSAAALSATRVSVREMQPRWKAMWDRSAACPALALRA